MQAAADAGYRAVRRHRRRDGQRGYRHLRIGAGRRSRGLQDADRRQRARRFPHRARRTALGASSAAATCWSCRRSPRSPPRRAWRPTTRRRPASSTSPTHFGSSSPTAASTSAPHTCLDRHTAGPGDQGRICRPSRRCCRKLPGPLEQDHVGREVRRGVRQGHRGPQAPDQLPGLGRAAALVETSAVATRSASATTLKHVPELLPRMDAEVAALGRSMSARTEALEKH